MEKILSDTIKLDKKGTGVLMIAHRGLSGLETENTECAFVAAGNRSYYGIETDVHFTKDGKYVISHDGNLSRVFGKDIEIKDYLYEDLRKVRKIEKGDTVEYMAVPTLREYFDVCRRYGKKSVLELKTERRVRIDRRRMGISEERVLPERETGRQFHGRGRGGQSDCDLSGRRNLSLLRFPARGVLRRDLLL